MEKKKKKKKKLAVSDVQLHCGHDEPQDEQVDMLAQRMLHQRNVSTCNPVVSYKIHTCCK